MRILIATAGSAGDINPFIAVGRALRARGHEVAMIVNPHFGRRVRAEGFGFFPLGDEDEFLRGLHSLALRDPVKRGIALWRVLMADRIPDLVRVTERAIEEFRPDVVLRRALAATGVRWVCERHGIPCAVGTLFPRGWMSRAELAGSPHPLVARLQRGLAGTGFHALRLVAYLLFERRCQEWRRRLGIPSERESILKEWVGGALNLGLWSPIFRPPMPDDPPRSLICGFPFFDGQHDGDESASAEELERFVEAGDPPIVFTRGTTGVNSPDRFFEYAAEACRLLGRRGVLLVGTSQRPPRSLPTGVRSFRYAPFGWLLPRGCCTVHHGGIGSTAQALRAGRPMVVVPFAFDQPSNAGYVRRLGVGVSVPARKVTPGRLAAAIGGLLDDPEVARRAQAIACAITREDGAAVAAAAIETLGRET